MKTKPSLIVLVSLAFIFACTFTVYSFVREIHLPKLPVIGQVHDFILTNEKGEDFSLKNLAGQVWVADFFFTTCAGICPMMSGHMAALNRSFEKVEGINLVSVSVNPEYDSPQVLSDYAKKYNAVQNKWMFLTGSTEQIKKLAVESFKLGSIEEPVFHSAYFTLVDRQGLVRGYYDGTKKEEINRLFKDAAQLLKEGRSGLGGASRELKRAQATEFN